MQSHAPLSGVAFSLHVKQNVSSVLEQLAHLLLHIGMHSFSDWLNPVEHAHSLGLVLGSDTSASATQAVHPVVSSHVLHRELQLALQEVVARSYAKPLLHAQLESFPGVELSLQLRQLAPLSALHVLQSPWHTATQAPLLNVKPSLHSQLMVLPYTS